MIPVSVPSRTSRLTPSTACSPPKRLVTSTARSTGSSAKEQFLLAAHEPVGLVHHDNDQHEPGRDSLRGADEVLDSYGLEGAQVARKLGQRDEDDGGPR